jgi:dipeptidyl aminopeptidase/acylaminoacyl peptidase
MTRMLALGGLLAALVAAGPAAADSLVFIKSGNVWLANANGSGQYQVTLDGTPDSPYSSPSQADDGTIVALRRPPGGRPQIWRMHQNGGLLNAPIDTPAPGTGAIDARVSPDGQLVAYWFLTEVSTGTCLYCFDITNRVLISHVDRFTSPDEVGTPNTGAWPSWMSNNRLYLSGASAEIWYYQLGRPEAVQWWGDSENCGACTNPPPIVNLSAGEVSRDGQRIAVVRGNGEETIALYQSGGPPPADGSAPPMPSPTCAFSGANGGKFVRPTWSQDGQTLAWQEGNGIWSSQIPDFSNCAALTSQLIVPGATDPDFGPAPVNPGPRPGCGNPGNPAACTTTTTTTTTTGPPAPPVVNLRRRLSAVLSSCASALKRTRIRGLVRTHRVTIAFTAPGAGTLTLVLSTSGKHPVIVASGRVVFTGAGKRNVVLRLTGKGLRALRHVRSLRGSLKVTFAPRGGTALSSKLGVSIAK